MNIKQFFTKYWIHFAAVLFMFILTYAYFSLQFDGYGLKQHDIEQYSGAAHEIADYREKTGEEPLWTNSMFGGMPAVQISVVYAGNFIAAALSDFLHLLPPPAGITFLYMLGFYILTLCLRINPWVGILGAVAFGFSSYDIIIIQAGHNTKALAVAFMAPVVGGFILAYQRNLKWGIILSALFMTLEMAVNHLQVTYYLGILLLALGVVMLIETARKGTWKKFILATVGILGAYGLALVVNYGNIAMTNDYAKNSIRGTNDLSLNVEGKSNKENATTGLDKDYITQYSNGLDESFTIISPYIRGSAAGPISYTHFGADFAEKGMFTEAQEVMGSSASYWGDQPQVSGPVYVGVIVVFLALLALFFINNPVKWALLAVTFLALALSWGKNWMGLTDFFLENIPGYNKFRAPTIIMVIVELCIPFLGVLFLDLFFKERQQLKAKKLHFFIASGVMGVILIGMALGLKDDFLSSAEKQQVANIPENLRNQILSLTPEQQAQYQIDLNNTEQINSLINAQIAPTKARYDKLVEIRTEIYNSSIQRSFIFFILGFGVLMLFFFTEIRSEFLIIGLVVLIAADLIPVSRNYLGSQDDPMEAGYKYWDVKANTLYPISEKAGDIAILEAETAQNPALAAKIAKGIQEGKAKADELGYEGSERRRVEDAYKYSALNSNTNFRVFDLSGGFNSASSAYYHKSLGGYHGAKLRNIQNVFDFHLSQMNNKVYDMLNVKYFLQPDDKGSLTANPNPTAMGNAWFVRKVNGFQTPDDEIRALGSKFAVKNIGVGSLLIGTASQKEGFAYGSEKIKYALQGDTMDVRLQNGIPEGMEAYFVMDMNGKTNWVIKQTLEMDTSKSFLKLVEIKVEDEFKPLEEAVMLKSEASKLSSSTFTGEGEINMTSYAPNKITYRSKSNAKQFAVFSEIYYPEGWTAKIDGKEVEIRKANYLLRGLEIPAGDHQIEFSFDLPKFHQSNTYALIGGLIIVLMIIGGIVTDLMQKRKKNGVEAPKA